MIIMKFGGSSVEHATAINQVIKVVQSRLDEDKVGVVVSAFKGVTDLLHESALQASNGIESYKSQIELLEKRHIEVIRELLPVEEQSKIVAEVSFKLNELENILYGLFLIQELSARSLDVVLGYGERLSAFIIAAAFNAKGIPTDFVDAKEIILTDENFGAALVDKEQSYKLINSHFDKTDRLQIVTGFVSGSKKGHSTTLGRGGSDYTASLLGAALHANRIEIFTDVSGVLSADPRKVNLAHPIPVLSYEEAMELSHFGAKVIYPPTMLPAMERNIPMVVKNTFQPEDEGTMVHQLTDQQTKRAIKGISTIDDVCLINVKGPGLIGVSGIAARIFSALANEQINIILITQASSEHAITIAVKPNDSQRAAEIIDQTFALEIGRGKVAPAKIDNQLSIIAVVGDNMRHIPGLAGQVFSALGRNGINIRAIAQGSSERNISAVIEQKQEKKALRVLHDAFFLSDLKTINIFLAGPGMIGSRVLQMLDQQKEFLRERYKLQFNLVGIARSKSYYFNEQGISLNEWKKILSEQGVLGGINEFVEKLKGADLANSIFIDCSSSQEIADSYNEILNSNISIATPNKKAASSSIQYYKLLQETARKKHVKFNYETNVGAGLPMVHTIRDLLATGDEIERIEGVFSGTLSYLFNTYNETMKFSSLIEDAKKQGFTEPDPRDDLNGMDMGRKILILARESGYEIELDDVQIESLVPEEAAKATSIDSFIEVMKSHDDTMKSRFIEAKNRGEKLCYLASFDGNKATVKLKSIGSNHPFYSLKAMDNIMAVYSNHYNETPLVVKGPGAGVDVTAGGVISDILRITESLSLNHQNTF